jgi:hypothetical protein
MIPSQGFMVKRLGFSQEVESGVILALQGLTILRLVNRDHGPPI